MGRHRVLLIVEAANPEWPSVPLEGWSHARAISEVADAHIVTQIRNRNAFLRAGLVEGVDFTAIDSEIVDAPMHRLGVAFRGGSATGWTINTAIKSLGYYYFDHLVWRRFERQLRRGDFQIVHQITPLSPTTASLAAGRIHAAGAKFVWGPINGGIPWPPGFQHLSAREREWLSRLRGAYRVLPGSRRIRESAAALVVGSMHTLSEIPERYRDKCIYVPENGIDPTRFGLTRTRGYELPLRAAFVGRMVSYKGADILIDAAVPLLRRGTLTLDLFGDGPELPRVRGMVEAQGLTESVTIHGMVDHARLQERLIECDLFCFPSVREFGGAVVLEAMALGLVPIVAAYGGPNEHVTDSTGFRIPMGSRSDLVTRFQAKLEELVQERSVLRMMAERARSRILRHFTWSAKARQMTAIYDWVLGEGRKPDFGCPIADDVNSR